MASCGKKEFEVIKRYDAAGTLQEEYTIRISTATQHGAYTKYYADKKLQETGFYKNGVQDSLRIIYHANGNKQVEEYYADGKIGGVYKAYFETGQLEEEGGYDAESTMRGKWKYYYPSGKLKEVITFHNNVENGPFIQYHPNGKKQAEGTYVPFALGAVEEEGVEQGELKEYDINGELIIIKDCNLGRCKTTWSKE